MLDQPDQANIIIHLLMILRKMNQFFRSATELNAPESLEYKILQYINEHFHEPLSIQTLCSKFFISRTQLYQRFKTSTGYSVAHYISSRRVQRAQELISQGLKPTDVYTLVGFTDYSTFYSVIPDW